MAFKSPLDQARVLTLTNPTDQNAQAPIIEAKPQRFTRRPRLGDYGLDYNKGAYNDYRNEYYYHEPDDIDAEIKHLQEEINKPENQRHVDFYTKRLNALSDTNLQKYLRDSRAYSKQFNKDYDEYYPTAKDAIIKRLLSNDELYKSETYGPGDYRNYADDIGDAINAEFAKKYGYDDIYDGDLFSPLRRTSISSGLGPENREGIPTENGGRTYRRPYDKTKYIAELLRSGELTLDDLKRYILGK